MFLLDIPSIELISELQRRLQLKVDFKAKFQSDQSYLLHVTHMTTIESTQKIIEKLSYVEGMAGDLNSTSATAIPR
jgi:hypothetical protein